jgi:hypothetical protein
MRSELLEVMDSNLDAERDDWMEYFKASQPNLFARF